MKILVVDNEALVAQIITAILNRAGHEVVVALSAADALKLCESSNGQIGLVISESAMPGIGGRELAESICLAANPAPLIFMSGLPIAPPTIEVIQAHHIGEVRFLAKPFTRQQLLTEVSSALTNFLDNSDKSATASLEALLNATAVNSDKSHVHAPKDAHST